MTHHSEREALRLLDLLDEVDYPADTHVGDLEMCRKVMAKLAQPDAVTEAQLRECAASVIAATDAASDDKPWIRSDCKQKEWIDGALDRLRAAVFPTTSEPPEGAEGWRGPSESCAGCKHPWQRHSNLDMTCTVCDCVGFISNYAAAPPTGAEGGKSAGQCTKVTSGSPEMRLLLDNHCTWCADWIGGPFESCDFLLCQGGHLKGCPNAPPTGIGQENGEPLSSTSELPEGAEGGK